MIARNSFVIMLSQAGSAVLGILALTVVSKLWGGYAPAMMGIIWFAMAFIGTFSFITNMGFDPTHIKKVSEGKDLGTCMGTFIAFKLILVGIMVATVVGGIAVWKYVLKEGFYDATTEMVVYIFLAYNVFFALSQIAVTTFNSRMKNVKSQIALLTEPAVRVALVLLVAAAGIAGAVVTYEGVTTTVNLDPAVGWPEFLEPLRAFIATHTIGAMAMAYMLGAFSTFCMAFFLLRKYPVSRPTREYMKMYLLWAAPLMIPMMFTLVTANIDKVMLGYWWSSVEVGYYASVYRISTMMIMISGAIGIVVFPAISAMHARKGLAMRRKLAGIAGLTRRAERYVSMVTVPLVAMIFVFAVPIIDILLNSSFRPAATVFAMLAAYTYIYTLTVPYTYLVIGMDRPRTNAKVVVLTGAINICLNILLIPRNGLLSDLGISGIEGAALSLLLSTLAMLAALHYYSNRLVRRKMFRSTRIHLHLAAGTAMGLAMWGASALAESIRWYHLGMLFALGMCVYLGVLWAFGEFRKPDLDFFLDTLNLRKLLGLVRSEMTEDPKFRR